MTFHRCISGTVQVFFDYELLAYGLVHRHEVIYLQYATFLQWKELQLAAMEPHNTKYYEVMVYTNAQMSIECRLGTRDTYALM